MKNKTYLICFFLLFLFFFVWSSIELYLTNQIDLDGDALYYFDTAINKTYEENFYPLYPLFITYFGFDNPYFTRFVQFLALFATSFYVFNKINVKNISYDSQRLFKIFYVTNFGVYLLAVQLVRDWMLFSLAAIIFITYGYEVRKLIKVIVLPSFFIILFPISQVLPIIIILSIFFVYIQFDIIKKKSVLKIFLLIAVTVLFRITFNEYIENTIYRSDMILNDKALIDESAKSNIIVGIFNFLFGPGIIRPLFPSKYYLVFTYYFSFLTWIAFLSWVFQFSYSIAYLISPKTKLNFSRTFFTFFYSFALYVIIYVSSFGGPGGLRKRMVAYFLFSLCTLELFSKSKLFPNSRNVNFIGVLISFVIILVTALLSV